MQRNLLSFVLLTAAVMTLNQTAFVKAAPLDGGQQLNYEIVESRPLPPNTGRVVLSRKTRTSAGFVKIAVGMREIRGRMNLEDKVQVFDENGNSIHSRQFEVSSYTDPYSGETSDRTTSMIKSSSRHGGYYSLQTIVRYTEKERNGLIKYEIFNAIGTKLWEEDVEHYYDSFSPQYLLSEIDGSVIRLVYGRGLITFYSPDGSIINEFIYNTDAQVLTEVRAAAFSEDGKYSIVNVTDTPPNPQRMSSATLMFNKDGQELWRFSGDNEVNDRAVGISPDNKYILTSDYTPGESTTRSSYLLDINGNLIQKYDDISFHRIAFSTDSQTAVIVGNRMSMIDLQTGQLLYQSRSGGAIFIDISSEQNLVAYVGGNRLYVSRLNGSTVFSYSFPVTGNREGGGAAQRIPYADPLVQISDDGSEIIVRMENMIYKFFLQ